MTTIQKARIQVEIVHDIAKAIRSLREVPSGHLYAHIMGALSLEQYEKVIDCLISARLVSKDGSHLLRWIGPTL